MEPDRRDEAPRPLGEILDRALRRMGAPESDALASVFEGWAGIVGDDLAAHVRPTSLHDGRLTVVADDAAWASRARWESARIVAAVDAATTGDVVEMRVRVSGPRGAKDR